MEFKNKLKELREEKGWSQAALAKFLNFSQSAVAKWELGRSEPNSTTLKKLADLFAVTTDYLLGKDDENPDGDTDGPVLANFSKKGVRNIQLTEDQYRLLREILRQADDNRNL